MKYPVAPNVNLSVFVLAWWNAPTSNTSVHVPLLPDPNVVDVAVVIAKSALRYALTPLKTPPAKKPALVSFTSESVSLR